MKSTKFNIDDIQKEEHQSNKEAIKTIAKTEESLFQVKALRSHVSNLDNNPDKNYFIILSLPRISNKSIQKITELQYSGNKKYLFEQLDLLEEYLRGIEYHA